MEGHRLRVGALAWSSSMLSSGSRDKSILQRDIRAQEDFVSKLSGHKSEVRLPSFFCLVKTFSFHQTSFFLLCCFLVETTYLQVCGLKWSYDNRELASGGNDNRVCG